MEKLKNAVYESPERPDFEAPVYHSLQNPLELAFKENLEKVNGSVYLFETIEELYVHLKSFLKSFNQSDIYCNETEIQQHLTDAEIPFSQYTGIHKNLEIGITECEFLVAHTGSVMVSSAQKGGRQMFVYPPVHIIIARKNQVVAYLENAYSAIQQKYGKNLPSQITIITGPSRTADIEKTLVMGAHGPRELHVFLA